MTGVGAILWAWWQALGGDTRAHHCGASGAHEGEPLPLAIDRGWPPLPLLLSLVFHIPPKSQST
jgi:hypothetical protein